MTEEYWVYYYVTTKDGIKRDPSDWKITKKNIGTVHTLTPWLQKAKDLNIELFYFTDEETAEMALKQHKKKSDPQPLEDSLDLLTQWKKEIAQNNTPVTSSTINNINYNKEPNLITEIKLDTSGETNNTDNRPTSDTIPNNTTHNNHGGKRPGAGFKKGMKRGPQSQQHKDKIAQAMTGNQYATKH